VSVAVSLLQAPNLQGIQNLTHGFTDRTGGVSVGAYASFNLGWSTGDDDDSVRQNYDLLASQLNATADRIFGVRQNHGQTVLRVQTGDRKRDVAGKEADALITDHPGSFLSVRVADCYPIFIVDPKKRVAGVAHAGWRGTLARILPGTVEAMHQIYHSDLSDLEVAVGPGIGLCCFEVSLGVASLFASNLGVSGAEIRQTDAAAHLDLGAINARLALELGIPASNIWRSPACTKCDGGRYYSYRRDGKHSGRMVGVIGWSA
jgi:YfiH family protein